MSERLLKCWFRRMKQLGGHGPCVRAGSCSSIIQPFQLSVIRPRAPHPLRLYRRHTQWTLNGPYCQCRPLKLTLSLSSYIIYFPSVDILKKCPHSNYILVLFFSPAQSTLLFIYLFIFFPKISLTILLRETSQ